MALKCVAFEFLHIKFAKNDKLTGFEKKVRTHHPYY